VKAYEIKIWPLENDKVWRIVEISDRQTLHHLSGVIKEEFRLTGDHLYCFYLGEKPYDSKVAYGGPNCDTEKQAVKTNLGALGLRKGRRFLFLYDFTEDRTFRLQVQRVRNVSDSSGFPNVAKRAGSIPAPPSREREEEPEAVGVFASRVGPVAESWSQGKRPSRSSLRGEYELAKELGGVGGEKSELVRALERKTGNDVSGWLVALPEALAAEGMVSEALELIDSFVELEPVSFLSDKPLVLFKAGRRDEARKEAEDNLDRFPEDGWVWAKTGNLLWQLGEKQRAERVLKRALELAGSAQYLRDTVLERLLALLEDVGKSQEARQLAEAEEKRRAKPEK